MNVGRPNVGALLLHAEFLGLVTRVSLEMMHGVNVAEKKVEVGAMKRSSEKQRGIRGGEAESK